MEQNTDRMYWTIGIIVIAAMVLLGTLNLVDAQVLPTIKDKIFNVFNNDKADDTKAIKETDTFLYFKLRDKDESKNEEDLWGRATKNADGTLAISGVADTESGIYNFDTSDAFGSVSSASDSGHGEVIWPDTINGKKVTSIKELASSNITFTGKLSLPKYLNTITDRQFQMSEFTGALSLPDNIEEIGDHAFHLSKFTGTLSLPSKIKTIADSAFERSTFDGNLNLPDSIEYIGNMAFSSSKFTGNIVLPTNLEVIESLAFQYSKFTGVIDVSSVKFINGRAFSESRFDSVIRGSVEVVPNGNDKTGIVITSIWLTTGAPYLG